MIDQNMADYEMLDEYYYALNDEDFEAKSVSYILMYYDSTCPERL